MVKWKYTIALFSLILVTNTLLATTVTMNFTTKDQGENSAGSIVISETKYGLLFKPNLSGLTPGIHGFHLHQHPSCAENGMAARGHLDPKNTNKHLGPYNENGHLGDLPILVVNSDGTATLPVLAPRLRKINEIKQHALMIHDHGDNYSDMPEKLGGGGGRMVCGIIN